MSLQTDASLKQPALLSMHTALQSAQWGPISLPHCFVASQTLQFDSPAGHLSCVPGEGGPQEGVCWAALGNQEPHVVSSPRNPAPLRIPQPM